MTRLRTTSMLLSVFLANVLVAESAAQDKADRLAEERRYHGTEVKPDSKATGADFALQARIARLMSANDFVPEARKLHYRSMAESERTPITGWYGTILKVTPDKEGTIVIVIFYVRPVGGFANLSKSTERYRFSDGKLRFLDLVFTPGVSTWN